jgi:hypothetical protein
VAAERAIHGLNAQVSIRAHSSRTKSQASTK